MTVGERGLGNHRMGSGVEFCEPMRHHSDMSPKALSKVCHCFWGQLTFSWCCSNVTISPRVYVLVQLLSRVWLLVTPWMAACQASLSFIVSRNLFKLMSLESAMSSNHAILCHRLLLLPSIFPRIRVFSKVLALHIRWPKYRNFSFSINPSNEYSGLISFKID